jgi:hypothetical protein
MLYPQSFPTEVIPINSNMQRLFARVIAIGPPESPGEFLKINLNYFYAT